MSFKFSAQPHPIQRMHAQKVEHLNDFVAVEEPLEIRLRFVENRIWEERSLSITMRTPGNDVDLALGFLFTEGILQAGEWVEKIEERGDENVIILTFSESKILDWGQLQRHFYTTSSCGVCGKSSIDSVKANCNIFNPNSPTAPPDGNQVESLRVAIDKDHSVYTSDFLFALDAEVQKSQEQFGLTGGIHACALFRMPEATQLNQAPQLIAIREDVGRHNALDKLIGFLLQEQQIPVTHQLLWLSGRCSFEMIQKAATAGIRTIAAVGAPTSLAIELADELGITLVGFLKGNRCNVYTHPQRILHTNH